MDSSRETLLESLLSLRICADFESSLWRPCITYIIDASVAICVGTWRLAVDQKLFVVYPGWRLGVTQTIDASVASPRDRLWNAPLCLTPLSRPCVTEALDTTWGLPVDRAPYAYLPRRHRIS